MKADRVWLITNRPDVDEGRKFVKSIQNELKRAGIECSQMEADRVDLFDVLRALRIIILR